MTVVRAILWIPVIVTGLIGCRLNPALTESKPRQRRSSTLWRALHNESPATGFDSQSVPDWEGLKLGMARSEVLKKIGRPDGVQINDQPRVEIWLYRRASVPVDDAGKMYQGPVKIMFESQGTVVHFQTSSNKPSPRMPQKPPAPGPLR